VVSVTDRSGEARYPSFKGVVAARKKPVRRLDLADLGIEPGTVGLRGARTVVDHIAARPQRRAGAVVEDDGEGAGAGQLAAFLAAGAFI
jgi:electron transfer flavoprotein beta subunit